jgi:hypothetical protein
MNARRHPPRVILGAALPVALAALLAALSTACNRPRSEPAVLVDDGAACAVEGDVSCKSGHCDRGLCCREGSCCATAADCPDSYRSAAACTVNGPTTDCQGTRRDATCQDSVCGSMTVPDDSGCNALARDCGAFDAVVCGAGSDQPVATCPDHCSGDGDCQGGYGCAAGACVAIVGLGDACTGTGRGSCAEGLKCENGVCCCGSFLAALRHGSIE